MPRCSQTAATASSSSTAPKLVEPAVAATAKTSRSVASRAVTEGVAEHPPALVGLDLDDLDVEDPGGEPQRGMAAAGDRERGALPALAAAPPDIARHRQGAEVARRAAADEDATGSRGKPMVSAIQPSASFSAWTAPEASTHQSAEIAEAETARSKRIEAAVGALGTKLRKRGWLVLTQAGASTSSKTGRPSPGPARAR